MLFTLNSISSHNHVYFSHYDLRTYFTSVAFKQVPKVVLNYQTPTIALFVVPILFLCHGDFVFPKHWAEKLFSNID